MYGKNRIGGRQKIYTHNITLHALLVRTLVTAFTTYYNELNVIHTNVHIFMKKKIARLNRYKFFSNIKKLIDCFKRQHPIIEKHIQSFMCLWND